MWRVAVNTWVDHPIAGLGVENYAVRYLQHRRTGEAPRYPHSLFFSTIAMLGIVGLALFAGFFGALGAAFARVRRRSGPVASGTSVAALCGAAAWLSHAMVDWLWEFPALTILGLGLLALACQTVPDDAPPARSGVAAGAESVGVRAIGALVAVLAAVSLVLPAAAARFERSAYNVQRSDPDAAVSRLGRAADIDRFSADPLLSRAVLLRNMNRRPEARKDLVEAVDREPENWFARFELGLLDAETRNWRAAADSLRHAEALNPRQPVVDEVLALVNQRKRVVAAESERALREQLSVRLQPFGAD
jgi:tetratricopeptide (TPR) repeat protein